MTDDETSRLADTAALVAQTESRTNLGRTGRQITETRYMMPWMRAYAEWLTLENLTPPNHQIRQTAARRLSRQPVTRKHLTDLHARDDFNAYCAELQKGSLETARAKFITRFTEYVDAHHDALKLATDAKDYKAMGYLSEPVLNRVFPLRSENPSGGATIIQISLTPEQAKGATAYVAPTTVAEEAEIVEEGAL